MIEREGRGTGRGVGTVVDGLNGQDRFERIRGTLLRERVCLDTERARLVTDYFRRHDDPSLPVVVRKARALRHLLQHKTARIWPDELIAGNPGSHRVSALLQPELASLWMSEDLLWIGRRRVTPLEIPLRERLGLLFGVFPYWLRRNLPWRALAGTGRLAGYVREQLNPTFYLINEAGGIGHFIPGYPEMLRLGADGFKRSMEGREGPLYQAARIALEGLTAYAERLAREAERQAGKESDPGRRRELEEMAGILRRVPAGPAGTFHEALQSLWLTHLGVILESLNSAVSFGRMDQYLYPYYRRDMEEGRLTRQRARELLQCFAAKAVEHVFLLSGRISEYHGGYLVVQAVTLGGMDREGGDATNELTDLFLEVMEDYGLRDPNFQARVHAGSPSSYLDRVAEVARRGKGMPAVYCDEAAVEALTASGYPLEEARDYGVVGCVELSLPGKSFFSTDAGLFNLPICLELALNRGRRFGRRKREGAATPDPAAFRSMQDLLEAFERQLRYMLGRMISDFHLIERGNRDCHPTPLSSLLVEGCLESGRDLTEGGARFVSSGIQGVGLADVADSLAALDEVVFRKKSRTMQEVVAALASDFRGSPDHRRILAELRRAPKFGNDHPLPDGYARWTAEVFNRCLSPYRSERGGPYVAGFYSVTCHVAFGRRTGALPGGRGAGEPFASSLSPANGCGSRGPTAVIRSVCSVPPALSPNGYALNLSFDPRTLAGSEGRERLAGLIRAFDACGGMEVQFNVLDPEVLKDARRNPGKYPGLVVRVAGYCAYFDDLPDSVKDEIIARDCI